MAIHQSYSRNIPEKVRQSIIDLKIKNAACGLFDSRPGIDESEDVIRKLASETGSSMWAAQSDILDTPEKIMAFYNDTQDIIHLRPFGYSNTKRGGEYLAFATSAKDGASRIFVTTLKSAKSKKAVKISLFMPADDPSRVSPDNFAKFREENTETNGGSVVNTFLPEDIRGILCFVTEDGFIKYSDFRKIIGEIERHNS